MIKIVLSEDILNRHKQYYSTEILPKVKELKNLPSEEKRAIEIYFGGNSKDSEAFFSQHNDFVDFCEEEAEVLSVGSVNSLETFYKKINSKFLKVIQLIEHKDVPKYNNFILKKFCYDQFKGETLSHYLLNTAYEVSSGKYDNNLALRQKVIAILKKCYEEKADDIERDLSPCLTECELKNKLKELEYIHVSTENYERICFFTQYWNAYAFVLKCGLRACPYCNRQYILPIYAEKGRSRPDLDHILPKDRYPYFSMSLHNLIPVCKNCNSVKSNKTDGFQSFNPYRDDLDENMSFFYEPTTKKIMINFNTGDKNSIYRTHTNDFKYDIIYNLHKNIAEELMEKISKYPDSYIEELCRNNPNLFSNSQQVKELIFGRKISRDSINDEAFSKLRRDIILRVW